MKEKAVLCCRIDQLKYRMKCHCETEVKKKGELLRVFKLNHTRNSYIHVPDL